MLFRRKIEPQCGYCRHGTAIEDGNVACVKKGIVSGFDSCPRFVYDPYARVPERAVQAAPAENSLLRETVEDLLE